MTMINNVTEFWESVTISNAEGWQCREGAIYISCDASGDYDRGVRLERGQAWPFPAGATVYYRATGGMARISREVIA